MFLIFVLCRENVYPIDDLGLQVGAGKLLGGERIRGEQLIAHGEKWHPYRSIATWYLWRGADALREAKKPAVKRRRVAVR
jgi:DNA-3-methyladenine glycosylase II